jgi:hypothetical protein
VNTLFDIPETTKAKHHDIRTFVGSRKNNVQNDFYPTPRIATVSFLEQEKFEGEIWEPACGDGAMSKVLESYGYSVKSTDLIDRGYGLGGVDFLKSTYVADNIVTNPPFSRANQFIHHALIHARRKVALLGRINLLETKKRQKLFTDFPFARLYVFAKRVPFGTDNAICFAWFVWEHGYTGKPTIGWV